MPTVTRKPEWRKPPFGKCRPTLFPRSDLSFQTRFVDAA